MIQRRTLIGAIGAVALSSASYFPMTACAAMPRGEGSDPIRIVVPYPPGGPLDVSARTIAEAVVDTLGNVIVDNRPGAGGGVGMGYVKRRPGDGRTLVVGAVATHAINPHLYKRLPYDAKKDFKAVTLIAHVPNVLVVTPEFSQKTGVKTVQNLVEYAKKNPGKLNYASGGNGSAGHMAGEWLKQIKDIDMVHVPFAGAAAAQLSVLAGQTDLIFDNLASATANIRAGKLLPLAVTTNVRAKALPTSRRCRRRASPTSTSPRGTASSCPPPRPTTWSRTSTRRSREPSGPRPFRKGLKSSAASPLRQRPKSSRSS